MIYDMMWASEGVSNRRSEIPDSISIEPWNLKSRWHLFLKPVSIPISLSKQGYSPVFLHPRTASWADGLRLSLKLQNFMTFNPPILHPRKKLILVFPLTGILSTPKHLLRKDGTVSTPLRNADIFLNSSVFRSRCFWARCWVLAEIVILVVLAYSLGLHRSR